MQQSDSAGNQQERFSELSWLGGIIDGEGSITLYKQVSRKFKSVRPKITIANTDREMVNKVIEILQKYRIGHHIQIKTKKGQSIRRNGTSYLPVTIITTEGYKRVNKFLQLIKPFLIAKAEKAKLLQEFVSSRLSKKGKPIPYDEKEKSLCLAIWRLNGNWTTHLNEFTENPQRLYAERLKKRGESIHQAKMMRKSELHSDMQRQAEMTCSTAR